MGLEWWPWSWSVPIKVNNELGAAWWLWTGKESASNMLGIHVQLDTGKLVYCGTHHSHHMCKAMNRSKLFWHIRHFPGFFPTLFHIQLLVTLWQWFLRYMHYDININWVSLWWIGGLNYGVKPIHLLSPSLNSGSDPQFEEHIPDFNYYSLLPCVFFFRQGLVPDKPVIHSV